jgi:hypothetical protein
MRVRSGSTPLPRDVSRAGGAAKTNATSSAGKAGAAGFAGLVDRAGSATDRESRGKNAMLEEMEKLAAELQNGTTSPADISRRFVGMVLEQRFGNPTGKGAAQLQERIGELVESDPNFVSRLQSQLKRLAKT